MLTVVITLVAVVIIFKSLYQIATMYFVIQYLERTPINESLSRKKETRLFLLLPVFKEQIMIERVLNYYKELLRRFPNITLVVVSNSKEQRELPKTETTQDIIVRTLKKLKFNRIIHLDYPKKDGRMPHQINFAKRKILEKKSNSPSWFFTLNIDSVYDADALRYLVSCIGFTPEYVVQCSTLFLSNFNRFSKSTSTILQAMALFQSRWTLAHELPRYLINERGGLGRFQFAHAVGHGMLISNDLFQKFSLPEKFPTEDTAFGFILRASNITIHPAPILELGDSPESVTDYLKQKYMWSFGPLHIFDYSKMFKSMYPEIFKKHKIRQTALILQGILNAISWQISSWIFLVLLVGILFLPFFTKLLVLLSLILYFLDYLLATNFFVKRGHITIRAAQLPGLALSLWVVILTHSLSANYALFKLFLSKLGLVDLKEYKTVHSV